MTDSTTSMALAALPFILVMLIIGYFGVRHVARQTALYLKARRENKRANNPEIDQAFAHEIDQASRDKGAV